MILLYNSDAFAVMQVDLPADAGSLPPQALDHEARSGIEIVDKASRKGVFLDGESAREFRATVEALVEALEDEDEFDAADIDAHLARYTGEGRQDLTLH